MFLRWIWILRILRINIQFWVFWVLSPIRLGRFVQEEVCSLHALSLYCSVCYCSSSSFVNSLFLTLSGRQKKCSPIFQKFHQFCTDVHGIQIRWNFCKIFFFRRYGILFSFLIFLTVYKHIIFHLCHFCTTRVYSLEFESVWIFSISFTVQEIS